MKKKLLIIAIVVIGLMAIISHNIDEKTFMEERVEYAMKYTEQNLEDLDIYKTGMELVDAQTANIDEIKATYETMEHQLLTLTYTF